MNNVERFENLCEEFVEVERDINAKKALNENNILKYGNIVLEKVNNQIQEEIKAIHSVFSLQGIGNLLKRSGMTSEISYSQGFLLINLDFKTKTIIFKHKKDCFDNYIMFCLRISNDRNELNTSSPNKYLEIFERENPEELLMELFHKLINKILYYLNEALKNLKEENEKMPILDFPFIKKIEEKQEQRIKIGEFEDYEVILEKKNVLLWRIK